VQDLTDAYSLVPIAPFPCMWRYSYCAGRVTIIGQRERFLYAIRQLPAMLRLSIETNPIHYIPYRKNSGEGSTDSLYKWNWRNFQQGICGEYHPYLRVGNLPRAPREVDSSCCPIDISRNLLSVRKEPNRSHRFSAELLLCSVAWPNI
jgi:hypothetical protein